MVTRRRVCQIDISDEVYDEKFLKQKQIVQSKFILQSIFSLIC